MKWPASVMESLERLRKAPHAPQAAFGVRRSVYLAFRDLLALWDSQGTMECPWVLDRLLDPIALSQLPAS